MGEIRSFRKPGGKHNQECTVLGRCGGDGLLCSCDYTEELIRVRLQDSRNTGRLRRDVVVMETFRLLDGVAACSHLQSHKTGQKVRPGACGYIVGAERAFNECLDTDGTWLGHTSLLVKFNEGLVRCLSSDIKAV